MLLLCFFAFLAGLVDAVVGGGGLIQMPALLLFLPAPLAGNLACVFGTNKLSSICGTSFAVGRYATRLTLPWRVLGVAVPAALVASCAGARVVSHIHPGVLKPLIFGLLVAVMAWTLWKKEWGRFHTPRAEGRRALVLGGVTGLVLGFYDGFFGPGTGSFLIAAFIVFMGFDFLHASACGKVVNLATNIGALLCFIPAGQVYWGIGLAMGACNLAGSFVGTRLALKHGSVFVRRLFIVVVTLLIARLGWDLLPR